MGVSGSSRYSSYDLVRLGSHIIQDMHLCTLDIRSSRQHVILLFALKTIPLFMFVVVHSHSLVTFHFHICQASCTGVPHLHYVQTDISNPKKNFSLVTAYNLACCSVGSIPCSLASLCLCLHASCTAGADAETAYDLACRS